MSPRRAKAIAGRVGDDPATALREHLIEIAGKLLADRQISAITTRDLARTAEVSEGVLYNYFADKNDLLLTALVRRFQQMVTRYQADLPEPGTATVEANLNAYARAVLDLNTDALPTATGLLNEPVLLHRFFDEIHREPHHPQIYRQRIIDYLAEEQRLGRVSASADPEAVATLLIGATAILVISGHIWAGARSNTSDQLSTIVATLIHGLQPPPPKRRGRGG